MRRDQLTELHFISPIANVPSILAHGILSHRQVEALRLRHTSVAMPEVQRIRARKHVPGGGPLHSYANLYINARNTMMIKRREQHQDLCVLQVSTGVLDLEGTVVADHNAATNLARFYEPDKGVERINYGEVYATWWTHDDPREQDRRRAAMCAEVLVPDQVAPHFIIGAYVSCNESKQKLLAVAPLLAVRVKPHLFFQK